MVEGNGVYISQKDWSLHRKGPEDQARHDEKVKEAIRDNLPGIISDEEIITADPNSKKIVKVPFKTLEIPHIRYKEGNEGIGSGGDGDVQEGDVIGKGKAGSQPGEEYYETEISLDELKEMVLEDLGLPRLIPKKRQEIETEAVVFEDVRKKRVPTNLDIYRTVYENMRRNAEEKGKAEVGGILPEDYRVRTWRNIIREENSAVVIAMRDRSGSMGENEKYLTRSFYWWAVEFLRSEYPNVAVVFITHDTSANEVKEKEFFEMGEGGGTYCSSANKLALKVIEERFSPELYNIYPLHFSDGDNSYDDNSKCVNLVKQMLDLPVNQYGYIQVGAAKSSDLLAAYRDSIADERFNSVVINSRGDVYPALKKIFWK